MPEVAPRINHYIVTLGGNENAPISAFWREGEEREEMFDHVTKDFKNWM